MRVLSSFLVKNLTDKGRFTSDIEKNTSEIYFFLGVIRNFLGQVVAIIADVEPRKVKRYLFSKGADLTFRGSAQVAPDSESTCGTAVCVVSFNTNLTNLSNRAG